MRVRCHRTLRKLDRWLELTDQEKQAVRKHAQDCTSCRDALESTEQILRALNQSAAEYEAMTYSGPVPPLPAKSPGRTRFFGRVPAWGWVAAAATLVFVLVWLGGKTPPTSDFSDTRSKIRCLHMPPMPSCTISTASIPLTPGAATRHMAQLQRKVGPLLHRSFKMPSRPKAPKPCL